ncbi:MULTISPECIES: DUF805 domain-containing protein [unclassified Streptomyces]|jgi:uncharacterized membrane protein YhaH (DUF805 family)|uniref:DUF805 domain-containing protein n=1 Tax=Streptomyces TaxID=1883 RepID=UPI002473E140|nr:MULTISPECIES: DUF805 domain-containing protein [unclassified Streptomyces]MDH6440942.1 uncharacterized membrane protein YhaH (DUF805 family) [Streptomyces sp. SAI-144]MDH6488241.1 uncharacterized membrane protein YhaH (DUF805 family) [Streptomyces sp. SAI-127]
MNYFLDVLKKYAVFSGRARRKEYWMYTLFVTIIYIVLAVIGVVAKQTWIPIVFYVAILLPSLAVLVRRLHDTGRSGWWVLFGLVPLAGGITLLVFTCLDGEPSDNKYGANPKGLAPAHV